MKSDEGRRDRFLRTRSLETDRFPSAEFFTRETTGLPRPLPQQGEAEFQISGDMTVHGVTKPITWDVTGQFNEDNMSGRATTSFKFEEFDIDVSRLRFIISVANDIRLKLDLVASVTRS